MISVKADRICHALLARRLQYEGAEIRPCQEGASAARCSAPALLTDSSSACHATLTFPESSCALWKDGPCVVISGLHSSKRLFFSLFWFFAVAAPKVWNSLPLSIKCSSSVDTFKANLKTFSFSQVFGCPEGFRLLGFSLLLKT